MSSKAFIRAGARAGAAIIVAAGSGRRLGGVAKALLRRADGESFLAAIGDIAHRAGIHRIVVVYGAPHGAITRREAERLGLDVVVNPDPSQGMASSVAVGFDPARRRFTECAFGLLWPVDHPSVQVATVHAIAAAAAEDRVVIPCHAGRGGHPSGFGRDLWQDLASCAMAPQGARSVIRRVAAQSPGRVQRIEVDDAGVVIDVDTPRDLHTVRPGPL